MLSKYLDIDTASQRFPIDGAMGLRSLPRRIIVTTATVPVFAGISASFPIVQQLKRYALGQV